MAAGRRMLDDTWCQQRAPEGIKPDREASTDTAD